MELERVSLAIEKDLLGQLDRLLARRGLGNRSEAIRDLIRRRLVEDAAEHERGEVVASLTLVYDHEQRELADRLIETGHHHHARVLATLHVHLDQRLCLEVQALRGRPAELRGLADYLVGLKGVKHGDLVMSSARLWSKGSKRARGATTEPHDHHHHEAPAGRRRKRRS
jgi:CopG family transcriptional regulator, nickel-responsive regulator